MNKQKLMAAFEKSLVELSSVEEPSRDEWSYPDDEAETYFQIFCAGYNLGASKND